MPNQKSQIVPTNQKTKRKKKNRLPRKTVEFIPPIKKYFFRMSENNLILQTDSYKVSHHLQYPPETKYVYSYFESRGGKYDSVLFFGLQYVIKKWLMGPVITEEKIQEVMKCRT